LLVNVHGRVLVHSAEGGVENVHVGVRVSRTRNRNALPLPATQIDARVTNHRLVTLPVSTKNSAPPSVTVVEGLKVLLKRASTNDAVVLFFIVWLAK
jgi:hypothetical protein